MTPEERDLMIKIGQSLTTLQQEVLPILRDIRSHRPAPSAEVLPQSFLPRQAAPVSTIDHSRGGIPIFKMDIVFGNGAAMTSEQRQETSMSLLAELEELLREYHVTSLSGTYGPQ